MTSAEHSSLSPAAWPPEGAGPAVPAPPRRLFRKYALLFVGLVGAALLINSSFDFWFSYQENKAALVRVQQEKANSAASRIEEFIDGIKSQIGWTTHPQWPANPLDQRRQDYARLLRQVPAITELSQLDDRGHEQLRVSRLSLDVAGSDSDLSQTPAFVEGKARRLWFSPIYFRKESEPYLTLGLARDGRNAGVTVAEINLKLIWDVITAMKIGQNGYAYVVDSRGRLIAHPDISLVLRETHLSELPQVAAALAASPGAPSVVTARNLAGREVLTAHAAIPQLGWVVFVEVPLREAFAPLYDAAWRTGLLLLFGLVAAGLAALLLARRMTGPIHAIAEGAARIGAGDLSRRIDIHTGDELEGLASEFNRMAGDLQRSYAELEQRVRDRTAELSEALEQQTATAEVVQVINSSPGDLAPVFDTMLDKAMRLCGAAFGIMMTEDPQNISRLVSARGTPAAFTDFRAHNPVPADQQGDYGRLRGGEDVVHNVDLKGDDLYRKGDLQRRAIVDLAGARTSLCVALRKDARFLGAIQVYRQEVRPFSEKQIALLQNFAAQAVIAMENARLITETQEALEQQTATAEVLQVINSSPGDLAPVFDAMLERAMHLCEAKFGFLDDYDGEYFTAVATRGLPADLPLAPVTPGAGGSFGLLVRGEDVVHVTDLRDSEGYRSGRPSRRAFADRLGARTAIWVALRKEGTLRGAFILYRQEVRPFTDKQIALLQNFAAQAVIAMENARLITETREALEQQTATAEVLQVINSSPGNLTPVFDAMLEKALHLCEATYGHLNTFDGECFTPMSAMGHPGIVEWLHRRGPVRPGAGTTMERIAHGERVVHIADVTDDPAYRQGDPTRRALVGIGGARTLLSVALRKDREILGVLTIYRQQVRPFSDKEITLLENFAAQAVIAIENARLITETREALEQQTATAEVLGVINSSPGNLAPVFDAILEKAHSLCGADFGGLLVYDGEYLRPVAQHNMPPRFTEIIATGFRPGSGAMARLIHGERFVHIHDLKERAERYPDEALTRAAVEIAGIRTQLLVPLRRDDKLLGVITANRDEPRPFSEKQIALLENFAAQAVIAMENARLIAETGEALEQQTATAEVLQVINSSPADLAPVFDAMLDKAMRLCDAAFGGLWTFDDDRYIVTALRGVPASYAAFLAETSVIPGPGSAPYRFLHGERSAIQNLDLAGEELYRVGDPQRRALVDLGGARTALQVALRRDDTLLGVITIYRQEVKPFSDKQVALLQNFAAQAVIAMENARLITETREALEQQTATAEVLGVINSSPGNLAPVFDAMLEKAVHLCEAQFGVLIEAERDHFRVAAACGISVADWEAVAAIPPTAGGAWQTVLAGEPFVHIPDIADTDAYRAGDPARRALVDGLGVRTAVWLSLRRNEALLGVFVIYRREARRFSDKQIALLQNFAAQAVIAMENARLVAETRDRTRELQELLEHQTAITGVLRVISQSPSQLQPVFDEITETAQRLCQAERAFVYMRIGDEYQLTSMKGIRTDLIDYYLNQPPFTMERSSVTGRVAIERRTVHIRDVAADPDYKPSTEVRTVLGVPLMGDGDTVNGVIVLTRQQVEPFTDKQIQLVSTFADQAVIAIENARLFDELRHRTRDLQESLEYQTATSDVLKVISQSTFDLEPVLQTVLDTAIRLCGNESGSIFRLSGEGYRLAVQRGMTPEECEIEAGYVHLPGTDSLVGRAALEARPVHILDAWADPAYGLKDQAKSANWRTMLGLPLLREGAPVGVICLARKRVQAYTDKQIELVCTFADQAVIAIENARLLNELRDRTRDLQESLEYQTATADVLKVISQSTFDLQPVLDTLVETAARLCDAENGLMASRDGDVYRVTSSFAFSPEWNALIRKQTFEPGRGTVVGRAVAETRAVQIIDVAADPDYALPELVTVGQIRTLIGVPLLRESEPIGVIALGRHRVEPFTERQIDLVRTFADQAVIAIENARLLGELRSRTDELARSVEELKALSEVGQAVSSTLDLRTVLSTILTRSVALAGADAGVIFRYRAFDRSFRFVEAVGWGEALTKNVRDLHIDEGATGMGEAVVHRAPLQIPDLQMRPGNPLRDLALEAGYRSVLIVPLIGADRIFGATILMRRSAGEFPGAAVRLMQTLASQSVLAIQNARLFREIADKSEQLRLASEHKSQFLANMSHELRTPLNAILGYAELLADGIYGELPQRAGGVLERVQNNGRHLLALINDVLDLAKIEAGQLTLSVEDYSLPDVVQSVVTATEPLASSKGLKMVATVAPGLPTGRGDARRLAQVLLNLVGNAVKFTDQGEVAIGASAAGADFVLTVRDTGPGIAPEDHGKIFEEFQQIDSSSTRKKGGTGLGLAISKRMVEMQGGTISVDSRLAEGASFRVTLPIRVEEAAEELMGAA